MLDTYLALEKLSQNYSEKKILAYLVKSYNPLSDDFMIDDTIESEGIEKAIITFKKNRCLPMHYALSRVKQGMNVIKKTLMALDSHTVQGIPIVPYLFTADGEGELTASASWRSYEGPYPHIVPIGGTHQSMVRAPHAEKLVKEITKRLLV